MEAPGHDQVPGPMVRDLATARRSVWRGRGTFENTLSNREVLTKQTQRAQDPLNKEYTLNYRGLHLLM